MAEKKAGHPDKDFLQMKVTGLTIDPFTSMPIIILKDLKRSAPSPSGSASLRRRP